MKESETQETDGGVDRVNGCGLGGVSEVREWSEWSRVGVK